MPVADNRALVERMHQRLLETRDVDVLDEFFSPDVVSHNRRPGMAEGIAGIKEFFAAWRDALPDARVELGPVVAEGDLVAIRSVTTGTHEGALESLPATGVKVSVDGIDIVRVEDGLIVEHWGLTDIAGLLRQIGPALGGGAAPEA